MLGRLNEKIGRGLWSLWVVRFFNIGTCVRCSLDISSLLDSLCFGIICYVAVLLSCSTTHMCNKTELLLYELILQMCSSLKDRHRASLYR